MDVNKAMANADDRQSIFDKHLGDVAAKPSALLSQSIVGMTEVRNRHMQRRLEFEADYRTNRDVAKKHFAQEKAMINASINELEKQLGVLRSQWSSLCDEEQRTLNQMLVDWRDQDDAQARLIAAEDGFIRDLDKK